MSKLRTVAKILLMYCIFSSASAFAEEILRVISVSRFTCMAGKLQGNEATSGPDCVMGRQSFFEIRIYTPYYNPGATAAARKISSTCPMTTISENKNTLELIIQRYGRSFQE
ncbi:hypothetical protein [Enterobacter kobei]|uniref:hypothetical protein n=1 Tax=Enterobacter kobei TaxID=208224 RepID=UPI00388E55D8